MEENYVAQLEQRVLRLETLVNTIKLSQEKAARQRVTEDTAFSGEIYELLQEVDETEEELRTLAKATKKLILSLQQIGMKEQLETLSERADMLRAENWITKKELLRLQ